MKGDQILMNFIKEVFNRNEMAFAIVAAWYLAFAIMFAGIALYPVKGQRELVSWMLYEVGPLLIWPTILIILLIIFNSIMISMKIENKGS